MQIEQLNHKIKKILASGNMTQRIAMQGSDEVSDLGRKFDELLNALEASQKALISQKRLEAIAKTTQMLAHDVKKPFTMLKMGLNLIAQAETPDAIQRLANEIEPEVTKALEAVNAMVAEVMTVDFRSPARFEAMGPEELIRSALNDMSHIRPRADIAYSYSFQHEGLVLVDRLKIMRVFCNIIDNAFQAMNMRGEMWFRSRTRLINGESYCEICIGNSGSFIEQDEIKILFEAFYTKGKEAGTGLGLAISEEIVRWHGGRIWCSSSREKGTEFFLTLKAEAPRAIRTSLDIPKRGAELSWLKRGAAGSLV